MSRITAAAARAVTAAAEHPHAPLLMAHLLSLSADHARDAHDRERLAEEAARREFEVEGDESGNEEETNAWEDGFDDGFQPVGLGGGGAAAAASFGAPRDKAADLAAAKAARAASEAKEKARVAKAEAAAEQAAAAAVEFENGIAAIEKASHVLKERDVHPENEDHAHEVYEKGQQMTSRITTTNYSSSSTNNTNEQEQGWLMRFITRARSTVWWLLSLRQTARASLPSLYTCPCLFLIFFFLPMPLAIFLRMCACMRLRADPQEAPRPRRTPQEAQARREVPFPQGSKGGGRGGGLGTG